MELFKSNLGGFLVKMFFDFFVYDVVDGQCWYNFKVIDVGVGCGGMIYVLVIVNNFGEVGGNWLDGIGMFLVVGFGVIIGCDFIMCIVGEGFICLFVFLFYNCSWDVVLFFSLLYEVGHMLGLGYSCGNDFDLFDYFGFNNMDNDINCVLLSFNLEMILCFKWNHFEILVWQLFGDLLLGCYLGCGSGYVNWYCLWKWGGIMCCDDFLVVGFIFIFCKVIYDQFLGGCQVLVGIFCGLNGWKMCFQKCYVLCVEDDQGI